MSIAHEQRCSPNRHMGIGSYRWCKSAAEKIVIVIEFEGEGDYSAQILLPRLLACSDTDCHSIEWVFTRVVRRERHIALQAIAHHHRQSRLEQDCDRSQPYAEHYVDHAVYHQGEPDSEPNPSLQNPALRNPAWIPYSSTAWTTHRSSLKNHYLASKQFN